METETLDSMQITNGTVRVKHLLILHCLGQNMLLGKEWLNLAFRQYLLFRLSEVIPRSVKTTNEEQK